MCAITANHRYSAATRQLEQDLAVERTRAETEARSAKAAKEGARALADKAAFAAVERIQVWPQK